MLEAIAAQLDTELGTAIEGVQIVPDYVNNPTPPTIDIYPADPFIAQASFGSWTVLLIVRARASTADQQAGTRLLLDLMDPRGSASLRAALAADATFGDTVDDSTVEEGPTGYLTYPSGINDTADLVGCEWRLRVVL